MKGLKNQANQLTEQLTSLKNERLKIQLGTEKIALESDKINQAKAKTSLEITREGLSQEQIKLTSAKVTTAIATEDLGRNQDKLAFTKADRQLDRQLMASKLQLKSFDLAEAREQIRHKQVMVGGENRSFGGGNLPKLGG